MVYELYRGKAEIEGPFCEFFIHAGEAWVEDAPASHYDPAEYSERYEDLPITISQETDDGIEMTIINLNGDDLDRNDFAHTPEGYAEALAYALAKADDEAQEIVDAKAQDYAVYFYDDFD